MTSKKKKVLGKEVELKTRGRKKMPKAPREERPGDDELLMIDILRFKLIEIEETVRLQREYIRLLENKSRRLRIWQVPNTCPSCKHQFVDFISFANKKLFAEKNYAKLLMQLKRLGYMVRERAYDETPPQGGEPYDGEVEYFDPSKNISDIPIPDGVGPELLMPPPQDGDKKGGT